MKCVISIFLVVSLTACLSSTETRLDRSSYIRPSPPSEAPIPESEPEDWPQESWHLFGENGINIIPAWEITKGSKNVTIAIMDRDFAPKNPAFSSGKCHAHTTLTGVQPANKSDYHGAMVASLINTCEGNSLQLFGINYNSPMLWVETGQSNFMSGIELLRWSAGDPKICQTAQFIKCSAPNDHPAHVINMSFGVPIEKNALADFRRIFLATVIKARDLGSILVAAAGNSGINAEKLFPASATGVITSGFTTTNGTADADSNWGETVEIMAPGSEIPVAYDNDKMLADGSSFAAPLVTGVISLMRSVDPTLNWKTAIYFLQSTAVPMDCQAYCIANRTAERQAQCKKDCCIGNKQTCTPGRMNAGAAVKAAQRARIEGLPPVALVDTDRYWVGLTRSNNQRFTGQFRLFNVGGKKGTYEISSTEGVLEFNGNSTIHVELAPKGKPGDSVLVTVKTLPSHLNRRDSSITIRSPESGQLSSFSDELTIYAGIVEHP